MFSLICCTGRHPKYLKGNVLDIHGSLNQPHNPFVVLGFMQRF